MISIRMTLALGNYQATDIATRRQLQKVTSLKREKGRWQVVESAWYSSRISTTRRFAITSQRA